MNKRVNYARPYLGGRNWLPRIEVGGDEWCNTSWQFIGPWGNVWIYPLKPRRDGWWLSGGTDELTHYVSPDYSEVATLPGTFDEYFAHDCPHTLPDAVVRRLALRIALNDVDE